ncbi:MAG: hypothetical protein K2J74_07515, partial [Muribaculaceae bacterium]|nr:hypothetical protein [Muribaculaceae bacterium]
MRLTDVTLSHNHNGSVTLSSNQYNEIGQVESTSLLNGIHNIDYKYNIRGWVTEIDDNSTLRMNLYYESNPENPSKSYYNGNISACNWVANSDDIERFFVYSYDNLNRLVKSEYSEDTWRSSGIFDTEYTYDLNTNITSLKRNGLSEYFEEYEWETYFSTVDNLTYKYKDNKSNKVVKITDSGDDPVYYDAQNFVDGDDKEVEYTYDANGNLTTDLNKGITQITYNQIGLPHSVKFSDGHLTEYLYDASGRKLQTKYLLNNFKAIEGPVIGEIGGLELGSVSDAQTSSGNYDRSSGNSPPQDVWIPIDPGIDIPAIKSPYTTISTRDYCGDYIYLNDTLQRINTSIGYMSPSREFDEDIPEEYYNTFVHYA